MEALPFSFSGSLCVWWVAAAAAAARSISFGFAGMVCKMPGREFDTLASRSWQGADTHGLRGTLLPL